MIKKVTVDRPDEIKINMTSILHTMEINMPEKLPLTKRKIDKNIEIVTNELKEFYDQEKKPWPIKVKPCVQDVLVRLFGRDIEGYIELKILKGLGDGFRIVYSEAKHKTESMFVKVKEKKARGKRK